MTKKPEATNYRTLKAELDAIVLELQSDELDIDQAMKLYERGLELVKQLETSLKSAENNILELKAKFKHQA